MIYNIHNRDRLNIGDMVSAPLMYLHPQDDFVVSHHNTIRMKGNERVVLGGGGILNDWFHSEFKNRIVPKNTVIWGAGTNEHETNCAEVPAWVDEYALVGIRDYGTKYNYVPCASCMSHLFDRKYRIQHDVVVFDHGDRPTGFLGAPTMTNFNTSFADVVEFLASGSTVVTSSYHGAYWAMLLNCKVVIVNAFSNKFRTFKYQPPISTLEDVSTALKRSGRYYNGYLEECRDANEKFMDKVKTLWSV